MPKLISSNNKFSNIKININNNSNENISNITSEKSIKFALNKNVDTNRTPCRSFVVLTKNSEKKDNSFVKEKPLINNIRVKIKNESSRSNILKYLKIYQIVEKENKHKKLLVKLNSINNPAINNCLWKIQNFKKMQKLKNMIENKYISKRIMDKRMELENIT